MCKDTNNANRYSNTAIRSASSAPSFASGLFMFLSKDQYKFKPVKTSPYYRKFSITIEKFE